MQVAVRVADPGDAGAIAEIYNHHVRHTVVTFEEEPLSAPAMAARMAEVTTQFPWLVLVGAGVLGYSYATTWKTRSAYRHTVESAIYLAPAAQGQGHGRRLYGALLDRLEAMQIHAVLGGIALPNPSSVALHEALGFVHVGTMREVGWKLGQWVDVGYWQRLLAARGRL